MQLTIEVLSNDQNFALEQTKSLKKWLESEESLPNTKVRQNRSSIKKGEAGGDLLTALEIVLSAPLLIELAKAMQVWFQEKSKRLSAQSPKLKLSITKPDGTKFDIDSENLGEIEKSIIEKLA